MKETKRMTSTNAFQKILDKPSYRRNKVWVHKYSEFYNRSMKSYLQTNNIEIYSTHNEGTSDFAERFVRTFKKVKLINT